MAVQGTGRRGFQTVVELTGPFFTKDVRKTVRQNIRDFEEALAAEGQKRVRSAIAARRNAMPRYTGWTHDHVIGRTRAELRRGGRYWATTAVISANTDGMSRSKAIRTKAAAAQIEARWHPFRKTTFALRALIRKLNITKGLE